MTASLEHTWVRNGRPPSGKGLTWQADSEECAARGWYARWLGQHWELCDTNTPGAVEDLQRLAHVRATGKGEGDAEWAQVLAERAEAEKAGVHRKKARGAKRLAGREG